MSGARNRATAAYLKAPQGPDAETAVVKLGCGLESGVVEIGGCCMDFCACSLFDGTYHHTGVSSMFPLPPDVAAALPTSGYNGAFVGLGIEANRDGKGVLAYLSGGQSSRPEQMSQAVSMALVSWGNPTLYGNSKCASVDEASAVNGGSSGDGLGTYHQDVARFVR